MNDCSMIVHSLMVSCDIQRHYLLYFNVISMYYIMNSILIIHYLYRVLCTPIFLSIFTIVIMNQAQASTVISNGKDSKIHYVFKT